MEFRTLSLNGEWQFTPEAHVTLTPEGTRETIEQLPAGGSMAIPTNWQRGGLNNFHGRVRFERTFEFDGLQGDEASVWLVFRAVDYYAQVWLNDVLLGSHEGYFQPFEFDVTEVIQQGVNHLRVAVTDPLEEPDTVWPHQKVMLKGVISHWDCRPGSWDLATGQDMNSGGIWHDVRLEARPQTYVDYVKVTTQLLPDNVPPIFVIAMPIDVTELPRQAMVTFDCELVGAPGTYTLTASVGGAQQTITVTQQYPRQRHSVIVQVANPQLWWTWDTGEPHLETCTVEVTRDGQSLHQKQIRTGLREIRFDKARGEWWLNGVRVFVRGTSVVPTLWLSEYDADMIAADIRLLKDAHVNAVRVCVHINRDEFYTACDEAGLLIWQDFAFQWGYTASHVFTQECVRQVKDMVRLLINHPSVALWCCQNESGVYNHHVLAPMMADAVSREDTSRFIHAVCEFGEHTYPGWYVGHYRDYSAYPATPILSEFGAQALPDVESCKRMAGESFPPDWAALAFHDFQYHQTFHIAGVELGQNWEEFVESSQSYQARLLKFSLELYRRAKYERLGGMFQFMFMDCWESVTWAVVGYNRVPKKGYHVLKQCYQPVLIGIEQQSDKLLVGKSRAWLYFPYTVAPFVVNDRHETLDDCTYQVSISGANTDLHFESEERFTLPADSVVQHAPRLTCNLPADLTPGWYVLRLTLMRNGETLSENTYDLEIVTMP